MQIDRIYYPVKTLGYGNRIGIWTIGCLHHCKNCSNPELWEDNPDKEISVDEIIKCVRNVQNADGITITGGDPFLQLEELDALVSELKKIGYEDILVYSGYTIDEIQAMGSVAEHVLDSIAILIDGRYVDELNDDKSFRGSSNQKIHRLNKEMESRYENAEHWQRKTQLLFHEDRIQAIGIPMKNSRK